VTTLADGTGARETVSKSFFSGTHRTVSPEETLRRVQPLMPRMGITRIANITGLDVIGVPVVAVTRPNARSIAVSQGKGLSLAAAKASALMESIENYHAENIRAPLVHASLREVALRGPVLDVQALPRIEGSAFDPGARCLWLEGHEIFARRPMFVPYEVVHTDYVLPLPSATGAFFMGDSGVASGNHPLEATSHAICELVERDALTLWRFQPEERRQARRVDLATVDDEGCASVLERLRRARVLTAVWDVTSDVGIPAFHATILDEDPSRFRPLGPASGSGCHPSREVALCRALTEACQARLTLIAGSRDDIGIAVYQRRRDPAVIEQALESLRAPARQTSFLAVPTHAAATIADDVGWELERLRGVGLEQVVVVDLTLPELGIPVVRVVIPGLEGIHDAPGFMPGRRLRRALA
jgi:YcaO-like protein with predicted kinase domain